MSPIASAVAPRTEPRHARARTEPAPLALPWPLAEVLASLRGANPRCTVYACNRIKHTLQIYTGLYALHRSGHIRMRHRLSPRDLRRRLPQVPADDRVFLRNANVLFVDVDDRLVCFDLRDGAGYFEQVVDHVALYAKRSFRRERYARRPEIFLPLGLNYSVFLDRPTPAELARAARQLNLEPGRWKQLALALARLAPPLARRLGVPTVSTLSAPPQPQLEPAALFLARTWPAEDGPRGQAVRDLNEFRARCIRALRARLGARFLGGFARSAHALEHYPDCLADERISTRRGAYLRLLQSYPVCVATTGLHESIGWKFGEYVALSRAIVSEPLRFELPGPIAPGENYLEFTTPEACVQAVESLLADEGLRTRMMRRNWEYHLEYGAPHAVVARVLAAALA